MKSFDSLIGESTRKTIQRDRLLRQVISQNVPAAAVEHVQFCRLEDAQLRITIGNASWISRLRFLERQLIDALGAHRIAVNRITWHVAPAEQASPRRTLREPRSAGDRAVAVVKSVARQIEDDRLSDALTTLGQRLSAQRERRAEQRSDEDGEA